MSDSGTILMIAGSGWIFGAFFGMIAGLRNFVAFQRAQGAGGTNYGWPLPAPLPAIGFGERLIGGLTLRPWLAGPSPARWC